MKPNTVPPAPVTTQECDPRVSASTSDVSEGVTPCKTVPAAPVTTQDSDPHVTASLADHRLFTAIDTGNLERVKRILSVSHVNINNRVELRSRMSLMMTAAQLGHRDVVKFLVGTGADVSLVDRRGNNALHWACIGGDLETVKLILSMNVVDINAKNRIGQTAADMARRKGRERVVDLLVSCGAH